MLTIRRHQAALFKEVAQGRFVRAMSAHVREHLPLQFAAVGEEGTVEAIRHGIARARSYRIESEAGVRVFIQLMFLFGPTFDNDPRLPWAARSLTATGNEAARVATLVEAAGRYLREQAAVEESGQ